MNYMKTMTRMFEDKILWYIKDCKTINNSPQIMTGTDITTYITAPTQSQIWHHIQVSINQMEIKWSSSYEESSEGDLRPFLGGGPAVNDGFLEWSNICSNSSSSSFSSSSLWDPSLGVGLAGGEMALIHVDYKMRRTNYIYIKIQFLIFSI